MRGGKIPPLYAAKNELFLKEENQPGLFDWFCVICLLQRIAETAAAGFTEIKGLQMEVIEQKAVAVRKEFRKDFARG